MSLVVVVVKPPVGVNLNPAGQTVVILVVVLVIVVGAGTGVGAGVGEGVGAGVGASRVLYLLKKYRST